MTRDVPPEKFAAVLGEFKKAAGAFCEICDLIWQGAEDHYFRRAKQIGLGETPLDHVSLENLIPTLKRVKKVSGDTLTIIEEVDVKTKNLTTANPHLTLVPKSKNSGK